MAFRLRYNETRLSHQPLHSMKSAFRQNVEILTINRRQKILHIDAVEIKLCAKMATKTLRVSSGSKSALFKSPIMHDLQYLYTARKNLAEISQPVMSPLSGGMQNSVSQFDKWVTTTLRRLQAIGHFECRFSRATTVSGFFSFHFVSLWLVTVVEWNQTISFTLRVQIASKAQVIQPSR